jgi:prepilin-type N-terminal cleavage/methylation domain-containing protein
MRRRTSAFTLVELLVVIAIIGILVALLLPAIQAAREAARRTECANKMKQLGIALHNYHDTHKKFPPDAIWVGASPAPVYRNFTWITLLLPYIEQQALYNEINFSIPAWNQQVTGPGGATMNLQAVQLAAFTCPSEPDKTCNKGFGLSSYAGAAGWDGHRRMFGDPQRAGPFSLLDSSTFALVTDGTSNTLFVGEVSMSSRSKPTAVSQWSGGGGDIRRGDGRVVRAAW